MKSITSRFASSVSNKTDDFDNTFYRVITNGLIGYLSCNSTKDRELANFLLTEINRVDPMYHNAEHKRELYRV